MAESSRARSENVDATSAFTHGARGVASEGAAPSNHDFRAVEHRGRSGTGVGFDFSRFLTYSLGSANELEYHLLLARDVGFLPADQHSRLSTQLEEVRRMLAGLMATLS